MANDTKAATTTAQAPAAPANQNAPATARRGLIAVSQFAAPEARSANADAIITRGGKLQRVATTVTLRMSEGDIYTIDDGTSWNIQAAGFDKMNQVAGLQFVQLPTVPVDGHEMPNPYVLRTKEGKIEGIYIRGALIGRDLTGSMRITMETLYLDPEMWFRLGLLKLADFRTPKRDDPLEDGPWSDAAQIMRTSAISPDLPNYIVAYPIDEQISVVVDMRAYKTRKLLETRLGVQRDFTKRALTVLRRRLFASHPGTHGQRLPAGSVKVTWGEASYGKTPITEAVAAVPVLGWIDDSPVQEKLAETLRRGQRVMEDVMMDDLGEATIQDDERDLSAAVEAEVVKAAPAREAPSESAPAPTAAELAKLTEAMGVLAQLAKMSGGRAAKNEIVAKWTNNEKALEDLTLGELDGIIGEALAAAQAIAAKAVRKPAASPEGGAS